MPILKLSPNTLMNETKVVAGTVVLDGTNPTPIQTGLRSIAMASFGLTTSTAPGLNTSAFSYTDTGGRVDLYAWKATSATNPTLIASTGTETVSFFIVGY